MDYLNIIKAHRWPTKIFKENLGGLGNFLPRTEFILVRGSFFLSRLIFPKGFVRILYSQRGGKAL